MNFRKLIAILVIALMLPLLPVTQDAQGQTVCPGVTSPNGWFRMNVTYPDDTYVGSQFTGGLYGSIRARNSAVVGGLDWLYNNDSYTLDDETFEAEAFTDSEDQIRGTNTTVEGESQVVTWWTQKNSRNTWVQYTNEMDVEAHEFFLGFDALGDPIPLGVHVQIFDENCQEVINFCDLYTPDDTHVYNLGDLTTNSGQSIGTASLQGNEGFMTVTPVVNCGTDDRAIEVDEQSATTRIVDVENQVDYGVNAWMREAVAVPQIQIDAPACTEIVGTQNGSVDGSDETGGAALVLNGNQFCRIIPLEPSEISQNYNSLGEGPAADVVLFSFGDVYNDDTPELGYLPAPATAAYFTDIFDDQENLISCPAIETCFARFGVNDVLPISEEFVAPTPEPTPTPEPSPTPTPDPGDTTTGGDGGDDGGGCTVASAVTASTAAANFLLPLLPLAGAYGIRRFRRRNSK